VHKQTPTTLKTTHSQQLRIPTEHPPQPPQTTKPHTYRTSMIIGTGGVARHTPGRRSTRLSCLFLWDVCGWCLFRAGNILHAHRGRGRQRLTRDSGITVRACGGWGTGVAATASTGNATRARPDRGAVRLGRWRLSVAVWSVCCCVGTWKSPAPTVRGMGGGSRARGAAGCVGLFGGGDSLGH